MALWLALALAACGGKELPPPPGGDGGAGDSGLGGGDGGGVDSAPPGDTDPGDSGADSAGGDTDTGEPLPDCAEVTFQPASGAAEDLTAAFTAGDPVTLDRPGALTFCPGAWFVQLILAADVAVAGMSERREVTVLSGGESATVVTVAAEGASVSLTDLTLDRGAALGVGNDRAGGGLRCEVAAAVALENVALTNHRAYDGGALYAAGGCAVTAHGAHFSGNETEDDGGALRLEGASAALYDVVFEDSAARDGGAIINDGGTLLIEGGEVRGSAAGNQGGALLHYGGALTLREVVFAGNSASGYGGALMLLGDATLEAVRFEGNAGSRGGGIYTYGNYGTLTCAGCGFSDNRPDDLYAIAAEGGSFDFGEDVDFVCDASGCR